MNPEHYKRISGVATRTRRAVDAVLTRIGRSRGGTGEWSPADLEEAAGALFKTNPEALWLPDFPTDSPFPKQDRLDLSGADLSGCVFVTGYWTRNSQSPLNGADLRGANLARTYWLYASLDEADFTGADLSGAVIRGMFCTGTSFRAANFSNAVLTLNGRPADLTEANLTDATIKITSFQTRYVLNGTTVRGCHLRLTKSRNDLEKDQLLPLIAGLSDEQRGQVVLVARNDDERQFLTELQADLEEPRRLTIVSEGAPAGKACFIATAACGGPHTADVARLRTFRDVVLARTAAGRAFIAAYECLSPPLARTIARSRLARRVVRMVVVQPARWLADWMLPMDHS